MSQDLFGHRWTPPDLRGKISIRMVIVREHHAAWLLEPVAGGPSGWLPFARGTRGFGPNANLFTLTRADAAERGWL